MIDKSMKQLLEKMKLGIEAAISRQLVGTAVDVDWIAKALCDRIVVKIVAKVTYQKLETVAAKYPADWWEAVKERWSPAWMRKRWPVRYKTVELTAWAKYPDYCIPGERCYFETAKSAQDWWEGKDEH